MTIAYLNNDYLDLEHAKVSVLDRGFCFGDSLYEVFPAYHKKPFGINEHLDRLDTGLRKIKLNLGKTRAELTDIINTVIAKNNHDYQYIYMQITRGFSPKRDHAIPATYQPTILITSFPFILKSTEDMAKGLTAKTVEDCRWQHCEIKATTLLGNILCLEEAKAQNADEAILIRGNHAVEAVSSNLFVVHKGTIKTPPVDNILAGITRGVILNIAQKLNIPHQETPITLQELSQAEEIWLTGSVREIMPVLQLNGHAVGPGVVGPVWNKMIAEYRKIILATTTSQ